MGAEGKYWNHPRIARSFERGGCKSTSAWYNPHISNFHLFFTHLLFLTMFHVVFHPNLLAEERAKNPTAEPEASLSPESQKLKTEKSSKSSLTKSPSTPVKEKKNKEKGNCKFFNVLLKLIFF